MCCVRTDWSEEGGEWRALAWRMILDISLDSGVLLILYLYLIACTYTISHALIPGSCKSDRIVRDNRE